MHVLYIIHFIRNRRLDIDVECRCTMCIKVLYSLKNVLHKMYKQNINQVFEYFDTNINL